TKSLVALLSKGAAPTHAGRHCERPRRSAGGRSAADGGAFLVLPEVCVAGHRPGLASRAARAGRPQVGGAILVPAAEGAVRRRRRGPVLDAWCRGCGSSIPHLGGGGRSARGEQGHHPGQQGEDSGRSVPRAGARLPHFTSSLPMAKSVPAYTSEPERSRTAARKAAPSAWPS